jgi:hypothetical protein
MDTHAGLGATTNLVGLRSSQTKIEANGTRSSSVARLHPSGNVASAA